MRYKVKMMYDGSKYYGWQVQPREISIQETIQEVLSRMHNYPIVIIGSGRTDSGVHALGQVFHFDSDMKLSCEQWRKSLNRQFPEDLFVLSVEVADSEWHARFDAIRKSYEYRINTGQYDPFNVRRVLQLEGELDSDRMRQAMQIFVGTHDFTSFCTNRSEISIDQVRTIYKFELIQEGQLLRFVIEGDGFMRYMVRMLIGVVIEAGQHKLSLTKIQAMLEAKSKTVNKHVAKACGLYLVDVFYKEESAL